MNSVKIQGTIVRVKRADLGRRKGCRIIPVIMKAQENRLDDTKMRRLCASALRAAAARGFKSVTLAPMFSSQKHFPAVAVAKIIAQEAFRHIREEKKSLREIAVAVESQKYFPVFQRTVMAYLSHILDKLSAGPFVTVDAIIEVRGGIVLIQRSNPPFGWAIPGGFVDYGESLERAVAREAREETGLAVKNLKQLHTYSRPSRDPRFHTVTTVFVCRAKGSPRAGSDAAQARVFKTHEWRALELAFDHKQVLEDYLKAKQR